MYCGYDGRTTPNFVAQPLDKLGILCEGGGGGGIINVKINTFYPTAFT